jgi:hypothetical protein
LDAFLDLLRTHPLISFVVNAAGIAWLGRAVVAIIDVKRRRQLRALERRERRRFEAHKREPLRSVTKRR